jgi:hypothetical protein
MAEMPEQDRGKVNLECVTLTSKEWMTFWRECMLERAWRALERHEHKDPEVKVFAVLSVATTYPKADAAELVGRIAEEHSIDLSQREIEETLPQARALFAQLIADEIVETLESPSKNDVKEEIKLLGIASAFTGLGV